MFIARLILHEIAHRKGSFLLVCLGLAVAVGVCLAVATLDEAARKETTRVQRDMGFNLRIIPRAADLEQFLLAGYASETMPEEVVDRLANQKTLAYNHLVATLQQPLEIAGKLALVTGIAPTRFPPGQQKPPMSPVIEAGAAHVGHQLAKRLGIKQGDSLTLGERSFQVKRVAPETGASDDLRVWLALEDAQAVLGKPGQINEIQAIDCLCLEPERNPQEIIRAEVARVAPEAQVAMLGRLAAARARQRLLMDRLADVLIPTLVAAAAAWVAILLTINVRQRRAELGVLRAVGYAGSSLAALILGKAILVGLAGAAVGIAAAWYLLPVLGPRLFPLTGSGLRVSTGHVWLAIWLTPLVAALAAFTPTSLAVAQDPARTLRAD